MLIRKKILTRTICSILLILAIMSTLQGCGRNPFYESFTEEINDTANLLNPEQRRKIIKDINDADIAGVKIVLVTLNKIDSREPGRFADDMFASLPLWEKEKAKLSWWSRNIKKVEPSDNGILILFSMKPKLIIIRVGKSLKKHIDEKEIHNICETDIYPLIMEKKSRDAIFTAVHYMKKKAFYNKEKLSKRNWLMNWIDNTISSYLFTIRKYLYPRWRWYYYFAFDPLLNILLLFENLFGYSPWVVIIFILILHIILRRDWLNTGIGYVMGYIFLLIMGKKEISEVDRSYANKLIFGLSGLVANIIRLGLGLPVWTILSLLIYPSWENVLTVKYHLYSWLPVELAGHAAFSLRGSFWIWDDITGPGGLYLALIFGIANGICNIYHIINIFYIMSLANAPEEQRKKLPIFIAISVEALRNDEDNSFHERLGKQLFYYIVGTVLLPFAVAITPFTLCLYYTILRIENALEILIPEKQKDFLAMKNQLAPRIN